MTKQAMKSESSDHATHQAWPKIVAAPAVWESGAVAHRLGRMPRSTYRPRRLAVDPTQRASLW